MSHEVSTAEERHATGIPTSWIGLRSLLRRIGVATPDEMPNRVLWGVAPTGPIHLGYAVHMLVLQRLRQLGCDIVLVLANFHGYLDGGKASWNTIEARSAEYRAVLARAGFEEIHETRDFYLGRRYVTELFRISATLRLAETLAAGVGTLSTPTAETSVGDALYVATQVLDAAWLECDCVICGIDESPIYDFASEVLPSLTGRKLTGLYMPMCPGIGSQEMHASDPPESKLLLFEPEGEVRRKLRGHMEERKRDLDSPLGRYVQEVLTPFTDVEFDSADDDGDGSLLGATIRAVQDQLTGGDGAH